MLEVMEINIKEVRKMKTEEEIKKLKNQLEEISTDKNLEGFVELTSKAGHWIDCLLWVLEGEESK